jgi:hypothetical protein
MIWGSCAFLIAGIAFWLSIGFELTSFDHEPSYVPFVKQQLSSRVLFRNPVQCGECDVKKLEALDVHGLAEFSAFCKAKFGLNDTHACHAIFVEQQNQPPVHRSPVP